MSEKALSKILLPDSVLSTLRPWYTRSWDLALAGWAVLLWLVAIGVFIGNLSNSVRGGFSLEFDYYTTVILVAVLVTMVAGSAMVANQRATGRTSASTASALVLLAALGVIVGVLGVVGIFVSLSLPASPLFYAVENIGGVVLSASLAIWALGELAKLPARGAAAPAGAGTPAVLSELESMDLRGFVPTSVSGRKETAAGWEIASLGWVLASAIFVVDILAQVGIGADFRGTTGGLLATTPLALFALTVAVRTRASVTAALGWACLDLAVFILGALGVLLLVVSVINFFSAFTDNGFGTVVFQLLSALGRAIFAAVIAGWALGELAWMRSAQSAGQMSFHEPAPAPSAAAPEAAGPPAVVAPETPAE